MVAIAEYGVATAEHGAGNAEKSSANANKNKDGEPYGAKVSEMKGKAGKHRSRKAKMINGMVKGGVENEDGKDCEAEMPYEAGSWGVSLKVCKRGKSYSDFF